MSNIIDTIQVSGVTYTIAGSGSGNSVVEVTQAQYDALVSGGTVDPTALYIITDAQAGDLTQYWTSAQTQSAITEATSGKVDTSNFNTYSASVETALSGKASQSDLETVSGQVANKQDTLVSGTNIKTINNQSLLGSGNITIQGGGGGGKAVSGGTNISITTGETADTINCTLPIVQKGNGFYSIAIGDNGQYINGAYYCVAEGEGGGIDDSSSYSHKEGFNSKIENYCKASHVEGYYCEVKYNSKYSHAEGYYTKTTNESEHSSGRYNVSNKANTTFGDSGNTLFSVGNGTSNNARHNAFEIRQNGDIYITSGGTDIKLQDHLGGGSITVDDTLSSTSTNPVQNKVVKSATDRICKLFGYGTSGQTDILAWATGATSSVVDDYVQFSKINSKKIIGSRLSPTDNFSLVETSAITSSMTSSSTDAEIPSAKCVYDTLGGLKLVKLTQTEYDNLGTKDSNTLYVITTS